MTMPDPNIKCPATGFAKTCRSIVAECTCPKYVTLLGTDPQTGQPVNNSGCVDSFLPMLLLENAQQSRQTGASVDNLRTEMEKGRERARDAIVRLATTGGDAPRLTG